MVERIKDEANLPSPRPIRNPPADIITQRSCIAAIVGDSAIHVVGPFENSLCKEIRFRQSVSPGGRVLVDALDPVGVRGAKVGGFDVFIGRFEEVFVVR